MVKIIEFQKSNPYFIFCNKLISKGLKFSSYSKCLFVLENLKFRVKKNNEEIFKLVFNLLEMYIYIFRKKVGGNVHPIPLYINKNVRLKKGLSNFVKVLKNKKEKVFTDRILTEIIEILHLKGSTINLRNNVYMAAAEDKSNLRFVRQKYKRPPLDYKKLYKF